MSTKFREGHFLLIIHVFAFNVALEFHVFKIIALEKVHFFLKIRFSVVAARKSTRKTLYRPKKVARWNITGSKLTTMPGKESSLEVLR